MLKIQGWWYNWDKRSIGVALMSVAGIALITVTTAPAFAQVESGRGMTTRKIYIPPTQPEIDRRDAPASYIYGSPIPTPILVNPSTGHSYRYQSGKTTIVDQTPLNPVLVNPTIQDSTLINPVIINQQEYRRPVYYRRYPRVYSPYGY